MPKKEKFRVGNLVGEGDSLKDFYCKKYFGYMVVAFTTENSLKYYSLFPWNFAIQKGKGWIYFIGIPNQVETRSKALRRAWYRAKWLKDGTWNNHYKLT